MSLSEVGLGSDVPYPDSLVAGALDNLEHDLLLLVPSDGPGFGRLPPPVEQTVAALEQVDLLLHQQLVDDLSPGPGVHRGHVGEQNLGEP